MRLVCAIALLAALTGCADVSPQARLRVADRLADRAGWEEIHIPAGKFVLAAFVPRRAAHADTLTVYIEGDGLAWLSPSRPSDNPTPLDPLGLKLALRQPQGPAVYLARPCQYVEGDDARNCRQTYWTDRRFAPAVIKASNRAVNALERRYGARRLVLVGYSGGGAVAALVAARRHDVSLLVTVAGNVDPKAWTAMHGVPALTGSLNPADQWRALEHVPQVHFVGGRDRDVSPAVVDAYVSRFPAAHRPVVITMPDFDHHCCWARDWRAIWSKSIKGRY